MSAQKSYPSPTDIRRFSRAAVRPTLTTVVTFLFSLEQSGVPFRHDHPSGIVFRDSVHGAYLYRNDNGEGINVFDDRGARAAHSARPQRPRGQRRVCRPDVWIRRELPFRHYSSGARKLRASTRERWDGRPRSPTARPELRTRRKRGALQMCTDCPISGAFVLDISIVWTSSAARRASAQHRHAKEGGAEYAFAFSNCGGPSCDVEDNPNPYYRHRPPAFVACHHGRACRFSARNILGARQQLEGTRARGDDNTFALGRRQTHSRPEQDELEGVRRLPSVYRTEAPPSHTDPGCPSIHGLGDRQREVSCTRPHQAHTPPIEDEDDNKSIVHRAVCASRIQCLLPRWSSGETAGCIWSPRARGVFDAGGESGTVRTRARVLVLVLLAHARATPCDAGPHLTSPSLRVERG
ncbi:hypothetical protein B0H13DRAFT_2394508 [Mycena leptocephala]|nr:hypothetical protein B0H13DRAFT_2394508 [Mycena leptocephala]